MNERTGRSKRKNNDIQDGKKVIKDRKEEKRKNDGGKRKNTEKEKHEAEGEKKGEEEGKDEEGKTVQQEGIKVEENEDKAEGKLRRSMKRGGRRGAAVVLRYTLKPITKLVYQVPQDMQERPHVWASCIFREA